MVTINYSSIIYSNDVEFVSYKILNHAPTFYSHYPLTVSRELLFQILSRQTKPDECKEMIYFHSQRLYSCNVEHHNLWTLWWFMSQAVNFLDPQFGHHNVKLIETIQIIAGSVYVYISNTINLLHHISYSFLSKTEVCHIIVMYTQMVTSNLLSIESNSNL